MKASELRIGNLVLDAFGDICDIDFIRICNVEKMKLQPIPITEEWLLKFGFRKDGMYYENAHLQLSKIISKNGYDCYCTDLDFSVFMTELEHIHQLQNLYFALTGEELTLNDKI
mgnify:CR=1 FL=1|jgi:hypothetical protein